MARSCAAHLLQQPDVGADGSLHVSKGGVTQRLQLPQLLPQWPGGPGPSVRLPVHQTRQLLALRHAALAVQQLRGSCQLLLRNRARGLLRGRGSGVSSVQHT